MYRIGAQPYCSQTGQARQTEIPEDSNAEKSEWFVSGSPYQTFIPSYHVSIIIKINPG
jgi:hypothetical protein